jgi:hypothetical protein
MRKTKAHLRKEYRIMNIPFPKLDQQRIAMAAVAEQGRRQNDIKIIQTKSKIHRAPAFTKFLVGRIYSDTSMSKAKRLKILEIRNRRKQADKAAKDMIKLKREIKEVKQLEKQVATRQAALQRKKRRLIKKSTVVLQKHYRGHLARRLVNEIKSQRAAVIVQKIFRGVSKRKQYMNNIHKHRKHTAALDVIFDGSQATALIEEAHQERAAHVIQSYMRKKLQRMKEELQRKIKAVTYLQCIVRGRKGRRVAHRMISAIARDRLASELFISQLRPSLHRIEQIRFSELGNENKRSYAMSLHASAKFRLTPSRKILAAKMSKNAKKILSAAKRTQQINSKQNYSTHLKQKKTEQRKKEENISSTILSSDATQFVTKSSLRGEGGGQCINNKQQHAVLFNGGNNVKKTNATTNRTFITSTNVDTNVVNNILEFYGGEEDIDKKESIVSNENQLEESQSYEEDFESDLDEFMKSKEHVNNNDDKINMHDHNENEQKEIKKNDLQTDDENYSSDNFEDDVSFGSDCDNDIIALNDSDVKKNQRNVNNKNSTMRQQTAYGRAVYKKNDGSPDGYRVPIRPSNSYIMGRSGTRQRRPGKIVKYAGTAPLRHSSTLGTQSEKINVT